VICKSLISANPSTYTALKPSGEDIGNLSWPSPHHAVYVVADEKRYWIQRKHVQQMRLLKRYWIQRIHIQLMRLLKRYWLQRIQIQQMRLLKRFWIQRIQIQEMRLLKKFWIQQYMNYADETLEKILDTADRFCIQRIHKQQMRLLKRYWIQRIQILQRRLLKLSNIKPLNPQMHCKN
jgi:hypothetical protein